MKRIIPVLLAVPFFAPAMGLAEIRGELSVGARGTSFEDDSSAKFDEYRDMSDGLFGGLDMLVDSDTYILGVSIENPVLDDQSYELSGNLLGVVKGEIFYDELTHQLYRNTLSPVIGTGGNFLIIPDADNPASVPPLSTWNSLDYSLESKTFGAKATVDPQIAWYFKPAVEHQRKEGIMPWGTVINSGFEVPMPIDYETSNAMIEAGYRGKGTTVVMTSQTGIAPPVLMHYFKHSQVLHERVLLLTIVTEGVPEIRDDARLAVRELGQGFWEIVGRYGFMETPDVPRLLEQCAALGLRLDPRQASYFLGRETILPTGRAALAKWRKLLFIYLARNARPANAFFRIPPNRVVELGAQIEL